MLFHRSCCVVKTSFIEQREDSWQTHLQQISPFLVVGVDVWWSYTSNGFLFHDGDTDPANPGDAFSLMHHRYHSVVDVEHRRDTCWNRIVNEKTVIPAHSIKLYDPDGNKTGRLLYGDHTVTLECTSTNPLDTSESEAFHNPETPITLTSEGPVCSADTLSMGHEDNETSTANMCAVDTPSTEHEDSETLRSTANTYPLMAEMCSNTQSKSSYINLDLEEHNEGLKTSVGNYIKHLLGSDDDLIRFDDLRFKLKEAKRAGNHLYIKTSVSEYEELVSKFKAKIRMVQSECVAKLEQKYFQQNGRLPAKTRGSHYYNILKERNVATAILRGI